MAITVFTVLAYFSKRNQFIMNKIVMVLIKSFYFNNTPIISISFLAISEYFIWETQHNNDVMTLKNKITKSLNHTVGNISLILKSVTNQKLRIIRELMDHILFLHIRELKLK
jgi:uncharacterized membrane protein